MGRYLVGTVDVGTLIAINFPTRGEVSYKKDYFMDFILGGNRDQRVYGQTKFTPSLTGAYDVDGFRFLTYVLGSITAARSSITVASTLPFVNSISVEVDGKIAGVANGFVDSWEITMDEGQPLKAEFTVIGKSTVGATYAVYNPDYASSVLMPSTIHFYLNAAEIFPSRWTTKISNGITPIYKNSILPQSLRATGCDVSGRLKFADFDPDAMTNGTLQVGCGTLGTLNLGVVTMTEVPPRVSGFDLPEIEFSFSAFPTAAGGGVSFQAPAAGTIHRW